MLLLKIYLCGWAVLLAAVLLNAAAPLLGLSTWYDFLKTASQLGFFEALRKTQPASLLFLILFYPFALGLAAYLGMRLAALWVR